jgi:hypothetical protein
MNRVETAAGTVGVLATLFGLGLLFGPDVVSVGPVEQLTGALSGADPTDIALVLGGAAVLAIVVAAMPRQASPAGDDAPRFEGTDTSAADTGSAAPDGDLLGSEVEPAIREGGERWREVRSRLAVTAADTYARAANVPPAEARRAVERGEWTDDDLVAGVVSGEPAVPRLARLRLWLLPVRERGRRLERTATAIERLQEGRL